MARIEESVDHAAFRVGALGAILTAVGVLTSGPLALLAVAFVQPQPEWGGPDLFVASFHRIQTLPFYCGFLLLAGSILMLASICALSKHRAAALTALAFASIGAAFAMFNYATQTTFIPAIVSAYSPDLGPLVSAYSMSNPRSLTWALEMWGYGFIGLGTWLAAGFFAAGRLEMIAKSLFILNGVMSVLGALVVSVDLSGVFTLAGLIGYGVWNVVYLALAVAFYLVMRKRGV